MAFKTIKKKNDGYNDIESLFRDLKTKGVESLYSHQADILRDYQKKAFEKANVAFELPTGSGKTLIGLLIAEYRRLTRKEQVVYLCPTRQLVNQVADLANRKYGISAIPFTGSKKNFNPSDKTAYRNANSIAITTYSSLFNINPFFQEPNLIVIDDAHTAENYISSCWSLNIDREENYELYHSILEVLKPHLEKTLFNRLSSDKSDPLDRKTVNVFSNFRLFELRSSLYEIIDESVQNTDLKFDWHNIKNHLHACNLYYSWEEILIRPLIPPSNMNAAFRNANQRVFMSATLGQGGDLERITGLKDFFKIPLPTGWDKQGLGRRLILFPSLSLRRSEVEKLVNSSIIKAKRSVILVSSEKKVNKLETFIRSKLPKYEIFKASSIEKSKEQFTKSQNAVAILANRFDGIDFPGDDCRLLIIMDLPYSANIQERFLQQRLGASLIFYDRNRTRLVQAIGRTTRSPKDYAAVLVVGESDLLEWFFLESKQKYFHPELQAELKFGMENSIDADLYDLEENIDSFFEQNESWKDANQNIIEYRNEIEREEISGEESLENAVKDEIKFMYSLWDSKYSEAVQFSNNVLEKLSGGDELKGYRAFWKYMKSYVSFLLHRETEDPQFNALSEQSLSDAIKTVPYFNIIDNKTNVKEKNNNKLYLAFEENIIRSIENIKNFKISNPRKYLGHLNELEHLLENPDSIEEAQVRLGELLGFRSFNDNTSGAPDPYWITSDNFIIVFEDKIKENELASIPLKDVRQAKTHQDWIETNVEGVHAETRIFTIMLTNQTKVDSEALFACENLYYWNYDNFIKWSKKIISFFKGLQAIYSKTDDGNWKDYLIKEFRTRGLDPNGIIANLKELKKLDNKS